MIEFHAAIFAWSLLVFFRTAFPCSGGYHLERAGMPLHDAVGVNGKNGATTGIQDTGVNIWAKGCVLDDCVSVF